MRPSGSPEGASDLPPGVERLQRTLARLGFGSRRGVEELIRAGRVTIDDRVATLGDRVDPSRAQIRVDGVPVPAHPDLRYLALNKPAGVTTTLRDRHAERSVAELIPPGPRVFPVGRLDRDSEGILLLTNDGDLAFRLQHPRYEVEKEYLLEVDGTLSRPAIGALLRGVELDDGPARAVRASILEAAGGRSAVSIVLVEGRKREARRMLAELGHPVRRLVRVRIGNVRLGKLAPGKVRPLSQEEVAGLYTLTSLARAAPGARRRPPPPTIR
jgi:23S rRNA pseudouridine2605 synthase